MSESADRSWSRAADRLRRDTGTVWEPKRWIDLWSLVEDDRVDVPWNSTTPFPEVADLIARLGPGAGRRAVVVGAAMGADAEALANAGWETTAFDISPAAVRLVRDRYPDSLVDYVVGDLLHLSQDLVGAFDLVVEVFTVQAMPPTVRAAATAAIRQLLAPGGVALVVQQVRGGDHNGPPWPLDRDEMESFGGDGFELDLHLRAERIWAATLTRR